MRRPTAKLRRPQNCTGFRAGIAAQFGSGYWTTCAFAIGLQIQEVPLLLNPRKLSKIACYFPFQRGSQGPTADNHSQAIGYSLPRAFID